MTKVLIVDDHEAMRQSLAAAFDQLTDFIVVGSIPSAAFARAYCGKLQPDLVIMDVCTEGGASGLSAAEEIRENHPNIKVIIMTAFDEMTYMSRAREVGAHAFLFKSKSPDCFIDTARGVMRGETHYPKPKAIPMPTGDAPLTERELEVLNLLCKHRTNKEIADDLGVSENAVAHHIADMLSKTGFQKTVDLAFHMISNGWINPLQ